MHSIIYQFEYSYERPPPFDDDENGVFEGKGNVYRGQNASWFVSDSPQSVDYKKYCKSSYRPESFPALLTRKDFKSTSLRIWDDLPLPLPHEFSEQPQSCSIRFRLMGAGLKKMPWLQLDGQVLELNETSTKLIKHVLGGRISILFEQLNWDGPWSAMMEKSTLERYKELFRKMDVDNSGTVDGGELEYAFEQLGIDIDSKTILSLVAKFAKNKQGDQELALNEKEFFEMMEYQTHGGRAWFVTAVCVLVPNIDYEHEIWTYREEEKKAQFAMKVDAVFDQFAIDDRLKTAHIESALQELGLHIEANRLKLVCSNYEESGMVPHEFHMLVENQHITDTGTAKAMSDKAELARKIEQKARVRLLRIKGTEKRIRVVEVERHYSSLNAGDMFLLDGWNTLWLWSGKDSSEPEREAARNHMNELVDSRRRQLTMPSVTEELNQGQESEEFWDLIGGQGPIAQDMGDDGDIAQGLPDPFPPIPERSKAKCRVAIIGAGVAGAICARTLKDNFKCEVVVFESEAKVGGRLGSMERGSIPFTAGGSYFAAQGPHLKKYLKNLLAEAAISEWKPRVGMVGKSAITSGEYAGFIPAINTQEEEVNIEAWIENREKTGAPRPGGKVRPATTSWDPSINVPIYDLPAPIPVHRRSHAQGFGQGHGSGSWYICKPEMASLVSHLLKGIDVRVGSRVQAVMPQLVKGTYEIVVENMNGTFKSQGQFNMVLICTPPTQAERLLADCQPSLMSIPRSIQFDPVWTILVAFDHPIFTPFDVLFVEEDACEPIRSAFRESSRYASYDPMKDMSRPFRATKQSLFYPEPPTGPICGGKAHAPHHRNAPSITSYGSPVDSWVIHCSAAWSRENTGEMAKEVAQVGIKAFLKILGLSSAPLRLLVSEAVLWQHGRITEPAVVHSMKPNVDRAFGPYCTFDPVTGIGMAGDWFVEGTIEGAFVSGLEMATLAGRSPIMFNEGQANPYCHAQFEITKNLRQRIREGVDIMSGYSSDSRASTDVGDDWDDLEWDQKVQLSNFRESHTHSTMSAMSLVKKDVLCEYEGCGSWIAPEYFESHISLCPFRPSARCAFAECGKYVSVDHLKQHTMHCKFGVYFECTWCFQRVPVPDRDDHAIRCLGLPKLKRGKKGGVLDVKTGVVASENKGIATSPLAGARGSGDMVKLPPIAQAGSNAKQRNRPDSALPAVIEGDDSHHAQESSQSPSPPGTRATEYSRATTAFPQTAGSQPFKN